MKAVIIFFSLVLIGFVSIFFLSSEGRKENTNLPQGLLSDTRDSRDIIDFPKVNNATPSPIKEQNSPPSDAVSTTSAILKTEKGNIEVALFPNDTPKTVMNFATLSKRGYYNNLIFHRVEDWLVQGGDPKGDGTGGESIYGPTFEDELNPNTASYKEGYMKGVLAMANRGPDTNSSQFFILKKDYPLEHNYTIFGKVANGMEIVDSIEAGDKILEINIGE